MQMFFIVPTTFKSAAKILFAKGLSLSAPDTSFGANDITLRKSQPPNQTQYGDAEVSVT